MQKTERSKQQINEQVLLARAARGDAEAAGDLVRLHWDEAFRLAQLILRDAHAAEDITQEGLIAALTSLSKFDQARPFRPWLAKIVANKALDQARRINRLRANEESAWTGEPLSDEADEQRPEPGELSDALERLDPDSRALLVLRYVLDYRSSEIAELLDLNPATVRSRMKRLLDLLRTTLTQEAR